MFITRRSPRSFLRLLSTLDSALHRHPSSYESKPCSPLRKSRGPIILMLRRSPIICTFGRRHCSPETSSARFYMVRPNRIHSPQLPIRVHLFARFTLGIVIMVFFKCMAALFNPDHRRRGPIKWGLVFYTVVMFSLVTAGTVMQLDVQSISYIDNRGFPGAKGSIPAGPVGYQELMSAPIVYVQNAVFALNNWLAEGLLVSSLLILCSLTRVTNAESSSSIVVMLFTP